MELFKIAGFPLSDAQGVQAKGKVTAHYKKKGKKIKKRNGKKVDKKRN